MLQLVILLTAISSPSTVRSNSPSEGPTTNEPLTRGVNEVGCNSTLPVFRCDEFSCVSKTSVCNGVPDCPDGQDESVQQCGCLPNEFSCSDSCVDIVKRCDRKFDCPGAEDELDCKSFTCPATHFKCNNFYCVPIDSVCNFEDDCGDKSDEADCKYRNCWNPEFRCNNGECIRPGFICDGRKDCKDGSDETNCGHDQFVRCGDGISKHKYYWCDGWPDCPDNQADEINCRDCKGDDDYLCPNGRCISKANVCDSQCDCAPTNGTECADEVDCDESYISSYGVTVCRLGETLSCSAPGSSKSNERCISSRYICDGTNHCYNGHFLSDETGCDGDPSSFDDIDVYKCADNRTIPVTLRCDFKYDCLDGDDEAGCPVPYCDDGMFRCSSGQCIQGGGRCNVSFDCWDKSDELECKNEPCPGGMSKCTSGQCVLTSALCDFFIDCPDGSDEADCELKDCTLEEFRCDNGQCVNKNQRCYLSSESHGGCADNSHLKNCVANSERGIRLYSYTVKMSKNSPEDSTGHFQQKVPPRVFASESTKVNFQCAPGLFKCLHGPCLNQSLICNGEINCKDTWDDEEECPFSCSEMAPQCECRDTHINCTNMGVVVFPVDAEKEILWFYLGGNQLEYSLTNETFRPLSRMVYLDLSNNSLSRLIPNMFRTLWGLTVLNLQNNHIAVIGNNSFRGLPSLKGLHLRGNNIEVLQPYAFYGLSSLPNLDLHGQRIRLIEPEAFVGLRNLVTLDLSYNDLTFVRDGVFKGMMLLNYLDIRNNKIQVIDSNVFRPVNKLEKLFTDEFRFCCLARDVPHCTPPQDEFSSCEDLMSNMVLRVCVWALALVATVGNLLVIACRARYKHCNQRYKHWPAKDRRPFSEKRTDMGLQSQRVGRSEPNVHSFLIINLALGDLLMGSYLLLIALVDWHFRGVYFIHDLNWRSSQLCSLAGFISTFSSELSVFTLTVITLDRFLVIIFPFRVRRLEMKRTKKLMALGWVLAIAISAVPLLHIDYFKNFYGRSGVCLALHITPDKPNGWEYSVFVFLVLNLVSFTIIAVGYLWMFLEARMTQHAVHKERRTSESAMAWRMTLLVATDAACWVPIIILGIVSLAGFTVPPQVFAWVAVFVLPLNAAVNPVLYTLSTAPFLTPARHGFLSFRRSCKMSLSQDQRRTFTSNLNNHAGVGGVELYSMTRRSLSVRNSLDTSVTEQGIVRPLHKSK